MFTFTILVYLIVLGCLFNFPSYKQTLANSPSFGHQEIRDDTFDIIDMCLDSTKKIDVMKCNAGTKKGNQSADREKERQSIDIRAVDYFSTQNILNTTIWLVSQGNKNTSNPMFISNYGIYIDADSNQKTGWQGIDYQIELSENKGRWNRTIYQFSSLGDVRVLKGPENHSDSFVKDAKYIDLDLKLEYLGLPENYRVMFYAEEVMKDNSCNSPFERACKPTFWNTDFTSWIEIPKQELNLTSTPNPVALRIEGKDSFGILLISKNGIASEVSSFNVKEPPSNMELQFSSKVNTSNKNPAVLNIKVSPDARIGTYIIPILADITKKSTIPPDDPTSEIFNLGNEVEEINLPVSILKKTTPTEDLTIFLKDYGVVVGLIAGGGSISTLDMGF